MVNLVAKLMLVLLILSGTIACQPKIAYKTDFGDPASPDDKSFVFSLRNSTILISKGSEKTADDSGKPSDQPAATSPANACPKNLEASDDLLSKCLPGVTAMAVAARDMTHFYVANIGTGTTITSTAIDTDPFMVKSITLNYKNPAVGLVTSAGAGASTGFLIGGPYGAVVGGLVGIGGWAVGTELMITDNQPPPPPWYDKVCPEDKVDNDKPDITRYTDLRVNKTDAELFLPVTIDYKPGSLSPTPNPCWHPLPNLSDKVLAAIQKSNALPPLSGWFYQIVEPTMPKHPNDSKLPPILPIGLKPEDKLDLPLQKRVDYFSNDADKMSTKSLQTFPVSACRSVELRITWWEMLKNDMAKGEDKVNKYPLTVADSDYVQSIRLPQNGTVYLLPVCGGYESPTQSSSQLGDVIDAMVAQAQAFKDAQSKYDSSKSK